MTFRWKTLKNPETNKHSQAEKFLQSCSARVEQKLEEKFRNRKNPGGLMDAIRYSSLGGGKKVRPALVYASARATGLALEQVDDIACSIELMHAYSLIHDDLPAMDNDDMRRGRPTLHKAFNEALAILAGDAMQTLAFEMLASSATLDDRRKVEAINLLAAAAGTEGMASGQAMDITLVGATPDIGTVEDMHRLKTGALMSACIHAALIFSDDLPSATRRALENYADRIGLCFQIRDDILDLRTDACGEKKPAYPAVLGLDGAEKELRRVGGLCLECLKPLNEPAQMLRVLTRYIVERDI